MGEKKITEKKELKKRYYSFFGGEKGTVKKELKKRYYSIFGGIFFLFFGIILVLSVLAHYYGIITMGLLLWDYNGIIME